MSINKFLALFLVGMFSTPAYSGLIDHTVILSDTDRSATSNGLVYGDFGTVDEIMAYSISDTSSVHEESEWMASLLGGTADDYVINKVEFGTQTGQVDWVDFWTCLDCAAGDDFNSGNIYGAELDDPIDNYLIKLGGGNLTYDTFLYNNLDSTDHMVVDLSWLDLYSQFDGNTFDVFRISHVSTVPEPSIIALMAAGLVGLGFARRRKKA